MCQDSVGNGHWALPSGALVSGGWWDVCMANFQKLAEPVLRALACGFCECGRRPPPCGLPSLFLRGRLWFYPASLPQRRSVRVRTAVVVPARCSLGPSRPRDALGCAPGTCMADAALVSI